MYANQGGGEQQLGLSGTSTEVWKGRTYNAQHAATIEPGIIKIYHYIIELGFNDAPTHDTPHHIPREQKFPFNVLLQRGNRALFQLDTAATAHVSGRLY